MHYRISFAQNREDLIIAGFFPDVEAGHYVDVGAGHPEDLSVTKLLYDRGWSGINVEPIPELAQQLRQDRPRDITVEAALSSAEGTATLRQYAGMGLSSTNPDVIAQHDVAPTDATREHVDYPVTQLTLAGVLADHPLPHIHFLKADVEGSEYEVLEANDWQRFRPELLCIETDRIVRDWTPLVSAAGYTQVFHDGINAYFLAEEAMRRRDLFDYAHAVLEGPALVTPEVARDVESLTATVMELEARHDAKAAEADAMREQLAEVRHELDQARTDLAASRTEARDLRDSQAGLEDELRAVRDEAADREAALASETELRLAYAEREAQLASRFAEQSRYLAEVMASQSWRLTKPLRRMGEIARARAPRRVVGWARRRRASQVSQTRPTAPEHDLSADGALMLDALTAAIERRDRRR